MVINMSSGCVRKQPSGLPHRAHGCTQDPSVALSNAWVVEWLHQPMQPSWCFAVQNTHLPLGNTMLTAHRQPMELQCVLSR